MSRLNVKSYIICLNEKPVLISHSSGAFAQFLMDDMRETHFEDVYGVELSDKTKKLEEAYEEEYNWDYIEVDTLLPSEAELRVNKIMKKKGLIDNEGEKVA